MNIIQNTKAPKEDIFKSGKFRSIVTQIIVMVLFVLSVLWIINNAATNMQANGISHGFSFLSENSMFDIGYLPFIDHTPEDTYFHAFIVGILNTILVAIIGIFFCYNCWFFYRHRTTFR